MTGGLGGTVVVLWLYGGLGGSLRGYLVSDVTNWWSGQLGVVELAGGGLLGWISERMSVWGYD